MNEILKKRIAIALIFSLPLIGVILSLYHAINIPLLDDYNFVFGFLEDYLNAGTFSEKINIVFAPSNHMIFATFNLIVLLDFSLFGKVDLTHFIFFNNLLHLLLLFLFYRIFMLEKIPAKYFIPIVFLLAVPNFAVQNWACYTAHVLAVVLVILAMWTLSRQGKKYFWFALLLAIVAAFSAGGGFLAFLAPIPVLYARYQRRAWIVWGASFMITLFLYGYLSLSTDEQLGLHAGGHFSVINYGVNFILFFGSVFKSLYQEYHLWAGIFGLLICGILALIFLRSFSTLKMHPLLTSGLIFAVLLAALITLTRSQYGVGATTAYRYRLYQFIPLVFIYLFMLVDGRQFVQKNYLAILGFSLFFFGFRMQHNLLKLQDQNRQLESGAYNFQITRSYDQLTYHTPARAGYWLDLFVQRKIFDVEGQFESSLLVTDLPRAVNLQPMTLILDSTIDTSDYYQAKGWSFPSYLTTESLEIYLFVDVGPERYYYRTGPLLTPDILMGKSEHGFVGIIDKTKITYDWQEKRIGVALWHPYQGIIAESFLP